MSFNAQVVRAVERILQKKTSGALIGQSGDVKRLIFFEQGALVGCRSNLADERLGDTMVREGRITEEQLRRAAEHIRSGRKMGQIMVALGYLKGGEIEGYVRHQILEVASRMLLEPCDRLVFSDQVPIDAVTLSPILMTEVFVIAARTLKDVQRCRDEVLTDEFVLIRVKDPLVAADRLDLSREELSVLDSVDSLSTTGDILRSSSLSPETILRALTGLLHAGLIDRAQVVTPDVLLLEDESPGTKDFEKLALTYRRVQNQNHWAVLSLEPGADYSRIERAYQNFRDEFAPAKFAHVPDAELQQKISVIQARLKDAFITLSAQSQAIAYGKLVQREEEYASQRENWELPASQYEPLAKDSAKAKKVFRRAVEAFRKKDYWTAIQLSRAAIELNEENDAEHYHLLGAALANNPSWRKDAEKHLKIATQLKSWEPRYLVTLARFYHREGNHQSAQQLLEQVKAIAPDHPIPDLDERRSKQAGVKR